MMKYLTKVVCLFGLALSALAADVIITTGQQGMTYNAVYGANLQSALTEFGYRTQVVTSKGSLDNLSKVASGEAQLGLTQGDAYQYWRSKNINAAQSVEIIGELPNECVFIAVKEGGKVKDEDDLKAGVKIAVGEPTSGSFASWSYLQSLQADYAKVDTSAKGGLRTLAKVQTGEFDAFLWVAAMDKTNKFLEAVNQKDSGIKLIDVNDWNLNDKLPNGKSVYEFQDAVVASGWTDTKVNVPCTKTLVVANVDTGDEFLETVSSIMLKNQARIIGSK